MTDSSDLFATPAERGPDLSSWIDTTRIPHLASQAELILFGAGQGSIDLLNYASKLGKKWIIRAIADNDASMHGKSLLGVPIIPPQAISDIPHNAILVTTISGKDAVARQLEAMELVNGTHFHCIGQYPSAAQANLNTTLFFNSIAAFLRPGRSVLHVGPGGFLGLECALHAMGVRPTSLDAYSFGADYPRVTHRIGEYQALRDHLATLETPVATGAYERFASAFRRDGDEVTLDSNTIPYLFPYRFSALPLEDESVDTVLSFAVLEHVRRPAQTVSEIFRVLKKGGLAVQRILTRDHRSFSKVAGYHPLSYLEHSQEQWTELTRNKFYQNRLTPREWRELFLAYGFEILYFQPLEKFSLDPATNQHILALNPDLTEMDLQMVNCDLIARKR
jgi:SAM-dependent methyltransferase